MDAQLALNPTSMLFDHNEAVSSGDAEFERADSRNAEQFGQSRSLVQAIRVVRARNQAPMDFVFSGEKGP
jgi:hypothetical protein